MSYQGQESRSQQLPRFTADNQNALTISRQHGQGTVAPNTSFRQQQPSYSTNYPPPRPPFPYTPQSRQQSHLLNAPQSTVQRNRPPYNLAAHGPINTTIPHLKPVGYTFRDHFTESRSNNINSPAQIKHLFNGKQTAFCPGARVNMFSRRPINKVHSRTRQLKTPISILHVLPRINSWELSRPVVSERMCQLVRRKRSAPHREAISSINRHFYLNSLVNNIALLPHQAARITLHSTRICLLPRSREYFAVMLSAKWRVVNLNDRAAKTT